MMTEDIADFSDDLVGSVQSASHMSPTAQDRAAGL